MGRQTMSSGMMNMTTITDRGMRSLTAEGSVPGMDGGIRMMMMMMTMMCDDHLYSMR